MLKVKTQEWSREIWISEQLKRAISNIQRINESDRSEQDKRKAMKSQVLFLTRIQQTSELWGNQK